LRNYLIEVNRKNTEQTYQKQIMSSPLSVKVMYTWSGQPVLI